MASRHHPSSLQTSFHRDIPPSPHRISIIEKTKWHHDITQHLSKPHFIETNTPSPHKISLSAILHSPRVSPSHTQSLCQNNLQPVLTNFGLGTSCSSPSFIASQLSTQLTHFELHALLILLCPTTTPLYPTPTLSTPHLKLPTLTLSISAGRRATLKRTVPINSSH